MNKQNYMISTQDNLHGYRDNLIDKSDLIAHINVGIETPIWPPILGLTDAS